MELQNVTFSYEDDDRKILQALNFQVYPGEQVTLSGRTGAGKSTVFKLLLGLYQPGEGKVLIQGRDAFRFRNMKSAACTAMWSRLFIEYPVP